MCTKAIRFRFRVFHIIYFNIAICFNNGFNVCFASSVESTKLSYKILFYKIRPININLTTAK